MPKVSIVSVYIKKGSMMEIASKPLNSKKSTVSVYMKSSLLSIDEFAVRSGISKNIIEECVKLGLIKTRKCKGETFILDVPAGRYQDRLENVDEKLKHQVIHARKIRELANKISAVLPETIPKYEHIAKKQIAPPQIVTPVAKPETADNITKTSTFLLEVSAKQTKIKTQWKLVALSILVLLCTAVLVNVWLYTDRNIKTNTIEKYNVSYKKMYEEAGRVHQNAEMVEDELIAYKAELESTRDSLNRTSQYLNIIEERNMKNNDKLSKQILKLADELSEPAITP